MTSMPATQLTEMPETDRPANLTDASKIRLDTSDLKSSYCNVCNVSSTKEEVVLSLGINQGWELERRSEIDVKLQHRIILSPFAAKRLAQMLTGVIGGYEGRYGELR
jgi:Protein of unknown function (DUF3467)